MMSEIIPKSRFVMEVAPPQLISVIRRPLAKILATIKEEESENVRGKVSASFNRSAEEYKRDHSLVSTF